MKNFKKLTMYDENEETTASNSTTPLLGLDNVMLMNDIHTMTFTTTECIHDNYTYRKARVNFYLFELTMLYKVCHKCSKITRTQKRWKIEIN